MRERSIVRYCIVAACLTFAAPAFATEVPDPHYCKNDGSHCEYYEAYQFISRGQLDAAQTRLIGPLLGTGQMTDAAGQPDSFRAWAEGADDLAASFLSITTALKNLHLDLGNGAPIAATDMIIKINRIEGDRVRFELDRDLFNRWHAAGANFVLDTVSGKSEKGHFKFNGGDIGGSLHDGYEMQGYTSVRKAPRIQINYRSSDGEADIDLDVAPWIGGIIPNPHHLTYSGSDTRQWLKNFVKKFGNPGFQVRLRSVN